MFLKFSTRVSSVDAKSFKFSKQNAQLCETSGYKRMIYFKLGKLAQYIMVKT